MVGLYAIKNIKTNKVYIGQSIERNKRLISHKNLLSNCKHSNIYLQHSWNKYGENSFVFCNWLHCDKSQLDLLEMRWIAYFKARNLSYNLESGGNKNKKHCLSTKIKIGISSKGKKRTKESIQKQIDRQKGKSLPKSTRIKLKQNHVGFKNKHHSEITKNKIRKGLNGHDVGEETRNKISQKLKGKTKSVEAIKKMRQSLFGHKISQKTRDKISMALIGTKRSKETKIKQSELKRKLTDVQINEIKFFRAQKMTYKEIGIRYNVCSSTIYNYCQTVQQ